MIQAHLNYYGGPVNLGSGDILEIHIPCEAWDDNLERVLFVQHEYGDEWIEDGDNSELEEAIFHQLCDMAVECMNVMATRLTSPVEMKLSEVTCYDADDVTIDPTDGEKADDTGFFYEGRFLHGKDLKHCAGNVSAFVKVMFGYECNR